MPPKIFAFFAGAGFLDLGFETEGFRSVFVNEYHEPFLHAYRYSHQTLGIERPEYGYSAASILSFCNTPGSDQIRQLVRDARKDGSLVGFIGGPPCPDFSVGGKNRGREGDRGMLSASYVDLICRCKPDFFLFENVKGLWQTKRHRAFFEELKLDLWNAGYKTAERLINAIEYGAPQDRDRIILLGFLDSVRASRSHHFGSLSNGFFPWTQEAKLSAHIAFSFSWPDRSDFHPDSELEPPPGIPLELTVEYWFRRNRVKDHPNAHHHFQPRAGLKRFLSVEEGDTSRKSYKRLHRWRYSPTACYGNNEVHLHPYRPRRISIAEALALQSLPREYSLPGDMTLSDMFKTVGNGVPYVAAKALARTIRTFLAQAHEETNTLRRCQGDQPVTQEPLLQLH